MKNDKKIIGRAERIRFPDLGNTVVHARIDSGARTSSIWGEPVVTEDGKLNVKFFGDKNVQHTFADYGQTVVSSSTGHIEKRYTLRLLVIVKGRKIRATFTVANREKQVYPVLVGRNILRGKFIVDVKLGSALRAAEKSRTKSLKSTFNRHGE